MTDRDTILTGCESHPEPLPKPGMEPVTPSLVAWLQDRADASYCDGQRGTYFSAAIRLVLARDAFGRQKYGTVLETYNGRDPVEDALQELGDLLQYVHQAKMEGRDIGRIRALVPVLDAMVEECGTDGIHASASQYVPVLPVNPEDERVVEHFVADRMRASPGNSVIPPGETPESIAAMQEFSDRLEDLAYGQDPDRFFEPRLPTCDEVMAWSGEYDGKRRRGK